MATAATAITARLLSTSTTHQPQLVHSTATLFSFTKPPTISLQLIKTTTKLHVYNSKSSTAPASSSETIFFDGGAHYGDLVANLLLGFTLVWLPLTLAAVLRGFFLRYRFTNLRVTVISGLTGQDRSDFSYKVIKDVQVVPRFIGEWGDVIITLKDGTKVDLRSVPRFREIANYCLSLAAKSKSKSSSAAATDDGLQLELEAETTPKGF